MTELLRQVDADARRRPTPCDEWTVQELVDHVVATPTRFAQMLRGESVDWAAPTPPAGADPARAFRSHADELVRTWQQSPTAGGVDWQCAEIAVHTWDLATALGRPTAGLDPEPAERGLAFMQASLTEDKRSPVFGPEQPAPDGADAYQRIAAFAGRAA